MLKTKVRTNLSPLAVYMINGKVNEVFYSDKSVNNIHAQATNYGRIVACEKVKVISNASTVSEITKIQML